MLIYYVYGVKGVNLSYAHCCCACFAFFLKFVQATDLEQKYYNIL